MNTRQVLSSYWLIAMVPVGLRRQSVFFRNHYLPLMTDAIMPNLTTGAEALEMLRDELQVQVQNLMSELLAFSKELADLQLGGQQPSTTTKHTRNTRVTAISKTPKHISFEDHLHQIRKRIRDKRSLTNQF
jgi:CHAD domain-containing protein